jgi:C-terminal processing protease CtpA/Prc
LRHFPWTASAAEGLVADLKGKPNVTIIGQATAGAVVGAEPFPIPGGWTLIVPTHTAWLPDGASYRDERAIPDISVPLSRRDLCEGTDAVLDSVLDLSAR